RARSKNTGTFCKQSESVTHWPRIRSWNTTSPGCFAAGLKQIADFVQVKPAREPMKNSRGELMSKKTPHQLSRRAFGLGTLSAATLTALAACAGGGGAGGSGGTTVAFANKGMNFFFFVVQNEAIKRKSEELDYQYKTTDANQDAGQQFNDWNSLLVSSPAFVIADPIDSKGLETVVKQT